MAARALHAVKPDEPAKAAPRMNVAQAAAAGNHRAMLEAMQARIAKTVDDPTTPPRDLAALSRRLQEIGKELEVLGPKESDGNGGTGEAGDESFDPSAI